MKVAKINIEYDGYDIVAQGFVMSGDVQNLEYTLDGVPDDEYPTNELELEKMEDFIRSELVESIYSPELNFND